MDFDLTWVLWALPVVFMAGWLASRFDIRQWRIDSRSAPKSYFKGLNYLLNEQQDEAIDAFIQAVQHDPDTTELHFALGNLFRSRGDHDRAVRVHQHLLDRADLSQADRDRAQHALSLDFVKAGLLDRAEASLRKLLASPYASEAQVMLLALYERTSDWAQAIGMAEQLESTNRGSFKSRMAHYRCEMAREHLQRGHTDEAQALLELALQLHPESARARLELAHLLEQQGHAERACAELQALAQLAPSALPLAAAAMARLAGPSGRTADVTRALTQAQAHRPSLDFVDALVQLMPTESPTDTAHQSALYLAHLRQEPSLAVAARWLALNSGGSPTPHTTEHAGTSASHAAAGSLALPAEVTKALNLATVPLQRYRCAACGFEASTYFWQCPGCQTWDSYNPRRVDDL